jgi:hypothetical protein
MMATAADASVTNLSDEMSINSSSPASARLCTKPCDPTNPLSDTTGVETLPTQLVITGV